MINHCNCTYCRNVIRVSNEIKYKKISEFNIVHWIKSGIVVTPTVGMYIKGHLLAISIEHIPNMGCQPNHILSEFEGFITTLIQKLTPFFGQYCIIEHGVGVIDSQKNLGQTIDHAHLHLIPINNKINKLILKSQDWQEINSLNDIGTKSKGGYLYYSYNSKHYICTPTAVENQWIRRLIFINLGLPQNKDWDWRKYSGKMEVNETNSIIFKNFTKKKEKSDFVCLRNKNLQKDSRILEIVFIRHSEPDYSMFDKNKINPIEKNFAPLKDTWIGRTYLIGDDVRLVNASIILTSPYTRAIQTAIMINRKLNLPVLIDLDIRQWQPDGTGAYVEKNIHIKRRNEYIKYDGNPSQKGDFNWESRDSIKKRVLPAISKYKQLGKIIVVTHSIVISFFTGIHPDEIKCGDIINHNLVVD